MKIFLSNCNDSLLDIRVSIDLHPFVQRGSCGKLAKVESFFDDSHMSPVELSPYFQKTSSENVLESRFYFKNQGKIFS